MRPRVVQTSAPGNPCANRLHSSRRLSAGLVRVHAICGGETHKLIVDHSSRSISIVRGLNINGCTRSAALVSPFVLHVPTSAALQLDLPRGTIERVLQCHLIALHHYRRSVALPLDRLASLPMEHLRCQLSRLSCAQVWEYRNTVQRVEPAQLARDQITFAQANTHNHVAAHRRFLSQPARRSVKTSTDFTPWPSGLTTDSSGAAESIQYPRLPKLILRG